MISTGFVGSHAHATGACAAATAMPATSAMPKELRFMTPPRIVGTARAGFNVARFCFERLDYDVTVRALMRLSAIDHTSPAPRAHLYFAPSTITGISVEYGYAGMPWSNRYSAASSTWTSPASEATTGLVIPLARISSTTSAMIFANTIGGVMIVCQ